MVNLRFRFADWSARRVFLLYSVPWGSSLVPAGDGVRESQGSAEKILSDVEVVDEIHQLVHAETVIDDIAAAIFETSID